SHLLGDICGRRSKSQFRGKRSLVRGEVVRQVKQLVCRKTQVRARRRNTTKRKNVDRDRHRGVVRGALNTKRPRNEAGGIRKQRCGPRSDLVRYSRSRGSIVKCTHPYLDELNVRRRDGNGGHRHARTPVFCGSV